MTNENTALAEISEAERRLQLADDFGEVLLLRDEAAAYQLFANAQGFKEAAQKAKIFQLRAERKAGAWLAENVKAGNPQLSHDATIGLPDGIDGYESSRWQMEARLPEEKFNEWVDGCLSTGKEISAAALQRYSKNPHVSYNTGEVEWYTPPDYISAAKAVLGEIDLDPASTAIANKIVKAKKYYTEDDSGLKKKWAGRVWMNPPYATPLVTPFVEKFVLEYSDGNISEGIILVNNATETVWFSKIIKIASAVIFPTGRVHFISPDGETGAPLQGQAVIYVGNKPSKFISEFKKFGWGAIL
jgi:ParB family chromosome partitioning protein